MRFWPLNLRLTQRICTGSLRGLGASAVIVGSCRQVPLYNPRWTHSGEEPDKVLFSCVLRHGRSYEIMLRILFRQRAVADLSETA